MTANEIREAVREARRAGTIVGGVDSRVAGFLETLLLHEADLQEERERKFTKLMGTPKGADKQ